MRERQDAAEVADLERAQLANEARSFEARFHLRRCDRRKAAVKGSLNLRALLVGPAEDGLQLRVELCLTDIRAKRRDKPVARGEEAVERHEQLVVRNAGRRAWRDVPAESIPELRRHGGVSPEEDAGRFGA